MLSMLTGTFDVCYSCYKENVLDELRAILVYLRIISPRSRYSFCPESRHASVTLILLPALYTSPSPLLGPIL